MWRRDCANPAPYRENPSAYPIDDGVGDEIPESLTYLCVLNMHGRGKLRIVRRTFKVPLEGLEETMDFNALLDYFHKIHLSRTTPAEQVFPYRHVVVDCARSEVLRVKEPKLF